MTDTSAERARFVKELVHDQDPRITEAILELLRRTDDDYLALGCFHRLIEMGRAEDILIYCRRRVELATTWKPELQKIIGSLVPAMRDGRPFTRELLPPTM